MAKSIGPHSWAINDNDEVSSDEQKDVEQQTLKFINDNRDVFKPLIDRLNHLKNNGDGDGLLLLSAVLGIVSNEIHDYLKAVAVVMDDKESMN